MQAPGNSVGNMAGRICLITGASGGLGKATALGLARLGASVIMASRDETRGEVDRAEVVARSGNGGVKFMRLDLASQQSVRDLAGRIKADDGRVDVLINNASVFKGKRSVTPDGVETMFGTNHLGHFLLTNLLLDELKASPQARVINITAPSTTRLDFEDLQGERKFNALSAFGASKMCNLLFTYELARRLAGTPVTSNALHPGLMKSNLMSEAPAPIRWLTRLLSSTPERASVSLLYLASFPQLASVTGKFFKGVKMSTSNPYSRDEHVQRRLWDVSAELVGLK
ncbi:MAG: SDR family NAD(P)-dependent oxidoreductase [Chloroflexota bacterium]|nr:SDR family NAD(P)-dependent oxidoreductase [Chloroflexota bacterium]